MTTTAQINDFAENAKFKVSRCTQYRYFNIDEVTQIRIIKAGYKHAYHFRVLLIKADSDGIFLATNHTINEQASTLKEAKQIAAGIYFKTVNG